MSADPRRVLVVDDDVSFRDSVVDYLEDEGLACEEAGDGLEMLEVLDRRDAAPVAAVLLDLRMPRLPGAEALQRLRERGHQVPVIVMSGTGDVADVVEILRLGACDYLTKPILELELLGRTVRRAMAEADLVRENRAYREQLERLVARRTAQLEAANRQLADKNTALREVLAAIEPDKRQVGEQVAATVQKVVLPLLARLRPGLSGHALQVLDQVETELAAIASPLVDATAPQLARLSATELRICHLIRRGLAAKEIADLEGVATATIQTHRRNIRRKLGLAGEDVNLASYLEQLGAGTPVE